VISTAKYNKDNFVL